MAAGVVQPPVSRSPQSRSVRCAGPVVGAMMRVQLQAVHDRVNPFFAGEAMVLGQCVQISWVGQRALGLRLEKKLLAEPRHFRGLGFAH